MSGFSDDLRGAARGLKRRPMMRGAVILCLALGIGANAAIFGLIDALLLRPPAVAGRRDLVEVWGWQPRDDAFHGASSLTFPDFATFRQQNHVFTGLAAFSGSTTSVVWSHAGLGEAIHCQFVTANFFSVLGVRPALGRGLSSAADEVGSGAGGIVVSNAFWRQHLGSDPGVIGHRITINGQVLTVVGVAPAGFTGVVILFAPDFWAPPAVMARLDPEIQRRLKSYDSYWLIAVGRLCPGVSAAQAQADLRVLAKAAGPLHGSKNTDYSAVVFPAQLTPQPVRGWVDLFAGGALVLTFLVLLIACANAANLLLAESHERRREWAVRSALGASRWRLVRLALCDSMLLALAGALAGLLLAWQLGPLLMRLKPAMIPLTLNLEPDWRMLGFAIGVGLLTGVIAGVGPGLRAGRPAAGDLKEGGAVGATRRSRVAAGLLVAQIGACVPLLIGAGLCVRSLYRARSIDPGFNPDRVFTAVVDLRAAGYSPTQAAALGPRLQARVAALPGVAAASFTDYLPLQGGVSADTFQVDGRPAHAQYSHVATGYFTTLRTPLLAGRDFTAAELFQAPRVAIVNAALAERYWPGQSAVGRQILMRGEPPVALTVVGEVPTGKYQTLSEAPRAVVYLPLGQADSTNMVLVARTKYGQPEVLLPALRGALSAINPNLVPIEPQTLDEAMALPLFTARLAGALFAVLGALALALAAIGLYAMFAFAVTRRQREIGVRLALGATRGQVLRMLLGEALRLYLAGAAGGLVLAFFGSRALGALLYGIGPRDPATFAGVTVFLGAIAILAVYLPARQAARLDPLMALRQE